MHPCMNILTEAVHVHHDTSLITLRALSIPSLLSLTNCWVFNSFLFINISIYEVIAPNNTSLCIPVILWIRIVFPAVMSYTSTRESSSCAQPSPPPSHHHLPSSPPPPITTSLPSPPPSHHHLPSSPPPPITTSLPSGVKCAVVIGNPGMCTLWR